jgi:exosortase
MAEQLGTLHQLAFFAVGAALVLLERVPAFQRHDVVMARRWPSNIGLFLIGSAVGTVLLPLGVYGFAAAQPPGPFEWVGLPYAAQFVITFMFLDLWRYWEHRLLHRLPLLWRFHLVHHSDTCVDVTTTERHHPLEIVFSTALLLTLIVVLRLPVAAIAAYLVTAEIVALYSHANVRCPAFLDAVIVTPAMHAVHHSDCRPQTDSNYGAVLTIWDRLFGTYVDPHRAVVPNFGLRYFHLPADTRLGRVLLQPFMYRRDLRYPERVQEFVQRAPRVASWPRGVPLASCAGLALVVAVMWPTIEGMAGPWRSNEAYQYAWLVVPMVAYMLVWHRRGDVVDPRPGPIGIMVAIVAALGWNIATLMNIDVGRQFAFVLAVQGIAMSTLGWRLYWRSFPTLALLFFMVPSGDLLLEPLRTITAKSIDVFASLANLPHSTDGYFIAIDGRRYFVADECAGLPFVTLATFLGYCFGLLLYRSFGRVCAMAAFGALVAIACNVLRVNAIVAIDWMRGSQMDLAAHGIVQWVILLGFLGVLFFVLSRAPVERRSMAAEPTHGHALPMRTWAPAAAGVCAFAIAGAAAGLHSDARQPPAASFTAEISDWNLAVWQPTWSIDPPSVASIEATYRRGARELNVVMLETLAAGAKLPEWKLAPGARDTWREKDVRAERGCAAAGCADMRHVVWQRDRTHEVRHVYMVYSLGDYVTQSRLALRAAVGWHRFVDDAANARLVGVVSGTALAADDAAEILLELSSSSATPAVQP